LNDKLSDIMQSEQGRALFGAMMKQMMGSMGGEDGKVMGFEVSDGMMKMMGGFTVIRLTSLMGTMSGNITKEQLLALNAQLNQIPKP